MDMRNFSILKALGEHERAGRLADALYVSLSAKKLKNYDSLAHIFAMSRERIISKAQRKAKSFMSFLRPISLHENTKTPLTYINDIANSDRILPPLISLTTISNRIGRIERIINSIRNQTLSPHSINLYISTEPYLLDQGIPHNSPILERLCDLGINIYSVPNIGPYRKQLPIIAQLRESGASSATPFITMDDDVIYPTDIVERLMEPLEEENAVIAHRGRELTFENGVLMPYKKFPPPRMNISHLNIGTGKNGIAYRLGYFPSRKEDFIGHILAPTADDLWCKWSTSAYCVPTVILEPAAAYDSSFDFEESEPEEKNGLFHKYNAHGTNDVAIANLESYFLSRGTGIKTLFADAQNV